MKQVEKLKAKIKKDLVIKVKDAQKFTGNRQAFYRLIQDGHFISLGDAKLGIYTLNEVDEFAASFAALAKYYPKCVVSGKTCLTLYGLGQDFIDKIDVDIPSSTNLRNSLFSIHKVRYKALEPIIERTFPDQGIHFKIKIYSPERALFEALKYYGKTDAFFRVLKRYRSHFMQKDKPGNSYAEILKIHPIKGRLIVDFLSMEDVRE